MEKSKRIAKNIQKKRVDNILKNAQLMSIFLSLGFRTLQGFKEVFRVYYPEVPEKDVRQLWNIRVVDTELLAKFENMINRLKHS